MVYVCVRVRVCVCVCVCMRVCACVCVCMYAYLTDLWPRHGRHSYVIANQIGSSAIFLLIKGACKKQKKEEKKRKAKLEIRPNFFKSTVTD